MMAMRLVVLASALAPVAQATGMQMEMGANPIRKVVTMLQNMQAKVTEEGKKAEELYENFMCYCKTGTADLSKSVEDAKAKVPTLESAVEEAESKTAQLEKDITAHKADREAAKKSVAEATAIREKEAAEFSKEFGDTKTNLAALDKAIAAIDKGMGGSFLQTGGASAVKAIAMSRDHMLDADRQELLAFLSGGSDASQSGEILGILKTMRDEMGKESQEAIDAEEAAKKDFGAMNAAKKKEIGALSKMIEEKLQRVGEIGVSTQTMKEDLEDTKESLAEDSKFLAELETSCSTKTAEFEEQKKTRAEEITALAETIKILNDDDALDLFKKTLPSPAAAGAASFLQVRKSSTALRSRAMAALREVQRGDQSRPQLDFIALALKGKKVGFGKIIALIDELVATLKAEQKADDDKKDYCAEEFDKAEDKEKSLERTLKDLTTVIAESKEGIATLGEEVAALEAGIKALDKSVAEATEQRKKENAEYKELMATNSAAKEIILFAKNRLNKFYNPKLYTPPPKEEAPVFVQLRARAQAKDAPPPPPETFGAYTKKSEESNGVIAMINTLVADLDKEMTEAEAEEKHDQKVYEQTMAESAEKRAQDSKSITDKEAAKAELQASLETSKAEKKSATKELMAVGKYIQGLHSECDWLLEYYDVRKEARGDEVEALGKAKAVLHGADYSFLQVAHSARKFLRA